MPVWFKEIVQPQMIALSSSCQICIMFFFFLWNRKMYQSNWN